MSLSVVLLVLLPCRHKIKLIIVVHSCSFLAILAALGTAVLTVHCLAPDELAKQRLDGLPIDFLSSAITW